MSSPQTPSVDKAAKDEVKMAENRKIGIISNVVGVFLLVTVSAVLGLKKYAFIALLLQWGVFAVHGFPNNSEKFYDASGSCTHLALIATALVSHSTQHTRGVLASVMGIIWLVRLGTFLFLRILRDSKDSRFDKMKVDPVRFLGVWTVQAVWVFLVDLPILILNRDGAAGVTADEMGLNFIDYVGILLWVVGFLCEILADAEKFVFRSKPENHNKYITTGLWAYSRHPNYFGEILMWLSICLIASNQWQGVDYLGLLSPIITVVLLLKVSGVPLVERAGEKKWGTDPAYAWYMKHTSCIIPMKPAPQKSE